MSSVCAKPGTLFQLEHRLHTRGLAQQLNYGDFIDDAYQQVEFRYF
jgi:hypothetical protein